MKNRKVLLLVLLVFAASLMILGACAPSKSLPTPELKKQGATLKWEAVDKASSYVLLINDVEYPQTETSFDTTLFVAPGAYTAKVKAISASKKFSNSEYSNTISFRIGIDTGIEKLDAPTGLKVKNNYLEFSPISGANGYAIYFGDFHYTDTQVTKVLLTFTKDGDYFIKVQALGAPNAINSDFSVALKVLVENLTVVKEQFVTPNGLYIENKILKWEPIAGVSEYVVSISGIDQLPTIGTSYDLTPLGLPSNLELRVKSIGDSEYATSSYSAPVYYPYMLKSPSGALVQGNTITWEKNTDAASYEVNIDGAIETVNDTKYIVNTSVNGIKNIKIRAKGDGIYYLDSMYSEEFFFNVLSNAIAPYVLPTPDGITRLNETIIWNAVPYSIGYRYSVNGVETFTESLSVALPMTATILFKVKAVANGENVKDSPYCSEKILFASADKEYVREPQDITLANGILSWNRNELYSSTEIDINGTIVLGGQSSYDLNSLTNGNYTIKVRFKMIDEKFVSAFSREIFYVKPNMEIERLQTPKNLRVENKFLMWEPCVNATKYEIYLDGATFAVTDQTSYDLSLQMTGKNMAFAVRAKNGDVVSNISGEIGYRADLGNSGDVSNPISIFTENDFWKMAERPNAYYVLQNDIVLTVPFNSVGSAKTPFSGFLDGKNFTVSGLKLETASMGIFGEISEKAVVQNIRFSGAVATNPTQSDFGIIAMKNMGTINNVTVDFSITKTGFGADGGNFGGLVGINYGIMNNVTANGSMAIATDIGAKNLQAQNIGYVCGTNYGYIEGGANGKLSVAGSGYTSLKVGGFCGTNVNSIKVNSALKDIKITLDCVSSDVYVGGISARGLDKSRMQLITANGLVIIAKGDGNSYNIGGIIAENEGAIVAGKNAIGYHVNSVNIVASGNSIANVAAMALKNSGSIIEVGLADVIIDNSAKITDSANKLSNYLNDYGIEMLASALVGINTETGNISDCNVGIAKIISNCSGIKAAIAGLCSVNLGNITNTQLVNLTVEQQSAVNETMQIAGIATTNGGAIKNIKIGNVTANLPYGHADREFAYGANENSGLIENAEIKRINLSAGGAEYGAAQNKVTAAFVINNRTNGVIRGVMLSKISADIETNDGSVGTFVAGLAALNQGKIEKCYSALVFGGKNSSAAKAANCYSVYAGVKINEGSLIGANIGIASNGFSGNVNAYALAENNAASGVLDSITLGMNVDLIGSNCSGEFYQYAASSSGVIKDIVASGFLNLYERVLYSGNGDINVVNPLNFAIGGNVIADGKTNIAELTSYAGTIETSKWTVFPFAVDMEKIKTLLGTKTLPVEVDATGILITDVYKLGVFSSDYVAKSLPIFFSSEAEAFTTDILGNINLNGNGTGGKTLIYFPNALGGFVTESISMKISGYVGVSGKGTESSPYIIKTESDFYSINVRPYAYYKLNNDITLTSLKEISNDFIGTLLGNGKTINISSVSSECGSIFANVNGGAIKDLTIKYKSGLSINSSKNFSALAGKLTSAIVDNVGIFFDGLELTHNGVGSFNGITAEVGGKSIISNSFVTVNATIKLPNGITADNDVFVDFNGLAGSNSGKINSSYFSGIVNVIEVENGKSASKKARVNELCGYNFGEIKDVYSSVRMYFTQKIAQAYLFYENEGKIENVLLYGILDADGADGIRVCGLNGADGTIGQVYIQDSVIGVNQTDKAKYPSFGATDLPSAFASTIWKKEVGGIYSLLSVRGQSKTYAPSGELSADIFRSDYLSLLLSKGAPYDVVFLNFGFTPIDDANVKLDKNGLFTAKKLASVDIVGNCGLATFKILLKLTSGLSGTGAQETPFIIKTEDEFEMIYRSSGYFQLGNNITFTRGIAPVGNMEKPFNGKIDGMGFKLINVTVSEANGLCGIFGVLGGAAELNNLNIENLILNVSSNTAENITVGGIAAYATGGAKINGVIIDSVTADISSSATFSGMIGEVAEGETITINGTFVNEINFEGQIFLIAETYAVAKGMATVASSCAVFEAQNKQVDYDIMSNKLSVKLFLEKNIAQLPLDFRENVTYSMRAVNEQGWQISEDGTIIAATAEEKTIIIKIVLKNEITQREMQYNLSFIISDTRKGNGFTSGSGFDNDPYIIANASQLQRLAFEDCYSCNFKFAGNIDMSGYNAGNFGNLYFADLDGGGFSIVNLHLTASGAARNVSLFDMISGAKIKNIIIENPIMDINFISGTEEVNIAILAVENQALIENITINNAVVNITSSAPYIFGGLVAENFKSIKLSKIGLIFTSTNCSATEKIGVVVGRNNGEIQYVEVLNTSVITLNGTHATVGGIAAITGGASSQYIGLRVRGTFDLNGDKAIFGGLFGADERTGADGDVKIKQCTVDISLISTVSELTAGGLVGKLDCRLTDKFDTSVVAVKDTITKGSICNIGGIFGELTTPLETEENASYYMIVIMDIKCFGLNEAKEGDERIKFVVGKLNGQLMSQTLKDMYNESFPGYDVYGEVIYYETYDSICDKANYAPAKVPPDTELIDTWKDFVFDDGAPYFPYAPKN